MLYIGVPIYGSSRTAGKCTAARPDAHAGTAYEHIPTHLLRAKAALIGGSLNIPMLSATQRVADVLRRAQRSMFLEGQANSFLGVQACLLRCLLRWYHAIMYLISFCRWAPWKANGWSG